MDNLSKEEAVCKERVKEKNEILLQLTKDIENQQPKLERVEKQVG